MSGALFQYPGAVVMTVVGAGAANFLTNPPGWLSGIVMGLSAVGVALVASAAKGLLMKLCNTNVREAEPAERPASQPHGPACARPASTGAQVMRACPGGSAAQRDPPSASLVCYTAR
jgi:hypothetical protein